MDFARVVHVRAQGKAGKHPPRHLFAVGAGVTVELGRDNGILGGEKSLSQHLRFV